MMLTRRNVIRKGILFVTSIICAVIIIEAEFRGAFLGDLLEKTMEVDSDKVLPNSNTTPLPWRCLPVANAMANYSITGWYFQLRTQRLNNFNYPFIEHSRQKCNANEEPFLFVLALTVYDHIDTRKIIRNTWGSPVRSRKWPGKDKPIDNVKMIFIYGLSENTPVSEDMKKRMTDEIKEYGDIVTLAFDDNYQNLTIKVLMGLQWVQQYCPRTKYILKVDEDVFIHVPNLLEYLKAFTTSDKDQIHGTALTAPIVNRVGKWGVSKEVYPFYRYPIYTSGTAYVISGSIVDKLITAAERMPFVTSEDAFITGNLRTAIGAQLCHGDGFTYRVESSPKPCSFHNTVRLAGTNTNDALKLELWSSMGSALKDCYTLRNRYLPRVPLPKWLIG